MECDGLRDDQWERIKDLLPSGRKGKRGPRADNRQFLDALLWMARSGGRWRDLPERLGDHRPMMRRYYRWVEMGVLDEMVAILARETGQRWLTSRALSRSRFVMPPAGLTMRPERADRFHGAIDSGARGEAIPPAAAQCWDVSSMSGRSSSRV